MLGRLRHTRPLVLRETDALVDLVEQALPLGLVWDRQLQNIKVMGLTLKPLSSCSLRAQTLQAAN